MRGTLRSEMLTSGIALRGHQGLTVTSQPFGVSWTSLSWEEVVDPAHYCLKSLSAWSTALTTGLGFSSLIPDTISHRFSRTELQLGAGSFIQMHPRWQPGQVCDGTGPGHPQHAACASSRRRRQKPCCSLHPWPTSIQTLSPPWKPSLLHCRLKNYICGAQHSTNHSWTFQRIPKSSVLPSFSLLSHKEALKKHIFQFSPLKDAI